MQIDSPERLTTPAVANQSTWLTNPASGAQQKVYDYSNITDHVDDEDNDDDDHYDADYYDSVNDNDGDVNDHDDDDNDNDNLT